MPEDIIVTAQRRSSTVREVPFSIVALGGDQLRAQQINSPAALATQVPGITINTADKSLSIAVIRGNVSTFRTATLDTPVAYFVDDVYYVFNNDLNSNFFDTQRVEVLRGPQGTLFGRNVVGGAIAVMTNNPEFNADYYGQVTGGNGGYLRTEGMMNGTVVDAKLAARIAFSTEHSDGLIDTPNQRENFGRSTSQAVRAKLLFTPTDTLKIILSGDYSFAGGNGGGVQTMIGGPQVIPATFGSYVQKNWTNNSFAPAPYTQRLRGGYLRSDLDLLGGVLTSISGYRLNNSFSFLDTNPVGAGTAVFGLQQTVNNRSFTQEVRFASAPRRLSYVVGAYYLRADVGTVNSFFYSPLPGTAQARTIPANPRVTNINRHQDGRVRSYAVFGEATIAVADRIWLIAGGRFTSDHKSVDYLAESATAGNNPIPAFSFPGTVTASGGKTWNAFTPRLSAKWRPVDAVNLYATYAMGFKSGGFVDNAYRAPTIPLDPERATNIEIGGKTRILDNRVDLNVARYRQKTKNLQNFSSVGGIAHTYNGTALVKGVEAESVIRVTDALKMNFNYAYTDGKYTLLVDPLANGADYSGNPIKYTPKNALTVGVTYTAHTASGAVLTVQSDFQASSRVHTDDANTLPLYPTIYDATQGRTLNARLNYESPDRRWNVGLWAKNLTNHYQVFLADDQTSFLGPLGTSSHYWKVFTNTPRTAGITVSIKQ